MPCSSQAIKFNVASQVAAACQGEAVVGGKYAESVGVYNPVSLPETVNRGFSGLLQVICDKESGLDLNLNVTWDLFNLSSNDIQSRFTRA